jgi:hypothetical protein
MSREDAPKPSRKDLKISDSDNMYVRAIKTAINAGATLEEVRQKYEKQIAESGVIVEAGGHFQLLDKAVEQVKKELSDKEGSK